MEPEPEALPPGPVTADGLQILRRSDGSPEYSQLLIRRILRTSIGDFHANSVRTKLASNSRRFLDCVDGVRELGATPASQVDHESQYGSGSGLSTPDSDSGLRAFKARSQEPEA